MYTVKEIQTDEARQQITAMNLECYYTASDRKFFVDHKHTKQRDAASIDARKKYRKMADNLRLKYKAFVTLIRKKEPTDRRDFCNRGR